MSKRTVGFEADTPEAISRRRFFNDMGVATSAALILPGIAHAQASGAPGGGLPGGNPIMPGVGMCDPHARVFGNAVYVYATHDMKPEDKEKAGAPSPGPGGGGFGGGQGRGGPPGAGFPGPPNGFPGAPGGFPGAGGAPRAQGDPEGRGGTPGQGAAGRQGGAGGARGGGGRGGFGFRMDDWWIWRTDDFIDWKQVSVLKPEQTYWGKPLSSCWAGDAIGHNGKYYYYVSVGPNEIGVVGGDTPAGPWKDPLGKPLVAAGSLPTAARDPGVLQEADGTSYLVFGTFDYYIARLGDDMISFAEMPRKIELDRKFGPLGEGRTDDKPYLHKRDGKYYLSWGCFYAMSDNVYGPYVYKGSVIDKEHTAEEFQKGLVNDRHASFFEYHGQWYFLCNDQSYPGQNGTFRTSLLGYLHYRDNGEMAPVELNRLGVGQYDAAAPRIEAENFFRIQGGQVAQAGEGYEVRGLKEGSSLVYPNVANLRANSRLSLTGASAAKGLKVEVRSGNPKGKLLGICTFPFTGDWKQYRTVECQLRNPAGKDDLCLVFKGAQGELMRLDSLHFA
jgi:arabinoxylan arabinofuranohydrolase